MAEDVVIIKLSGTPSFIVEGADTNWYTVTEMIDAVKANADKRSWTHSFDVNNPLVIGLDMKEVPTRNLSLLVRTSNDGYAIRPIVYELKKFARLSGCDYYSLESIAGHGANYICTEGRFELFEVRPRLFRKIVND